MTEATSRHLHRRLRAKVLRTGFRNSLATKKFAKPWKKRSIIAETSPSRKKTARSSRATSSIARPGRHFRTRLFGSSPRAPTRARSIPYSDIAALAFTGRDTAAGKNWETWIRRYWEKKAAGESYNLVPDTRE